VSQNCKRINPHSGSLQQSLSRFSERERFMNERDGYRVPLGAQTLLPVGESEFRRPFASERDKRRLRRRRCEEVGYVAATFRSAVLSLEFHRGGEKYHSP
jgi:hypothetical protein